MAECSLCDLIAKQKAAWRKEKYEVVKRSAQLYAREQRETVAIFRDGIEWKFISAELAGEQQITVSELVSQY